MTRNRVDPRGRLFETRERGYLMGNRDLGEAWIACSLRHPDGTTRPSAVRYFKLFFLDEATALAAGHRPCAMCRRKDYELFKRLAKATSAEQIDRTLRDETSADTTMAPLIHRANQLPAGAMFEVDGKTFLAWQRVAYLWAPGGYTRAGLTKEFGKAPVLTPPSTLRVLEAGYRPWVHPSVMRP